MGGERRNLHMHHHPSCRVLVMPCGVVCACRLELSTCRDSTMSLARRIIVVDNDPRETPQMYVLYYRRRYNAVAIVSLVTFYI